MFRLEWDEVIGGCVVSGGYLLLWDVFYYVVFWMWGLVLLWILYFIVVLKFGVVIFVGIDVVFVVSVKVVVILLYYYYYF